MRSELQSRAISLAEIKIQVGRGCFWGEIAHPLISVFVDFLEALLSAPACTGLGPLSQWVDFMNDRDMSIHSDDGFELPRVFTAMCATDSYVGKVSHELCYDGVVITANHRLEPRLRIRIESRPLILGEDALTQGTRSPSTSCGC